MGSDLHRQWAAQGYGISEETVREWKKRTSVQAPWHAMHRRQTTVTSEQKHVVAVVAERNCTLRLPPDDLQAVTRKLIDPGHPLCSGSLCVPPRLR